MTIFKSNEEFLEAVDNLIARLEFTGHVESAAELKRGLQCLNGLTDGWALLLQSIESIRANKSRVLEEDERRALDMIHATVHATIYRR